MLAASVELEAVSIFGGRNAVYLVLGELDDVGTGRRRGRLIGVGGARTGGIGGMDAVGHGRRRERERDLEDDDEEEDEEEEGEEECRIIRKSSRLHL